MIKETDTLLADGGGEWFLYRTHHGRYIVHYTRDFYLRRNAMLPAFDVNKLTEYKQVTEEEAREIWLDIRDYYGTVFGEVPGTGTTCPARAQGE